MKKHRTGNQYYLISADNQVDVLQDIIPDLLFAPPVDTVVSSQEPDLNATKMFPEIFILLVCQDYSRT